MNVDLDALMMANLQTGRDAKSVNCEPRESEHRQRQTTCAIRPNSNDEAKNGASVQEFWSA